MRGLILALAGGLAFATSVQAAPLAPKPLDGFTYLTDQEWMPLSNDMSALSSVAHRPSS